MVTEWKLGLSAFLLAQQQFSSVFRGERTFRKSVVTELSTEKTACVTFAHDDDQKLEAHKTI